MLASESGVQKRALKLPTSVSTVAAPLREMVMIIFVGRRDRLYGPSKVDCRWTQVLPR